MANVIGTWAVKIVTDASNMLAGFRTAAASTKRFAEQARGYASWAATGISGAVASLSRLDLGKTLSQFSGMGSALLGIGMAALTLNPYALAGGVLTLGGAFMAYTHNAISSVAQTAKLARMIGTTTEEAKGLSDIIEQQGGNFEETLPALRAWAVRLGALRDELRLGNAGEMTRALESIGINAERFSQLRAPEQFADLAAALQRLPTEERLAAAANILSRRGLPLVPLLQSAPGDIRNAGEGARRSGFRISEDEAAAVVDTTKSFYKLKESAKSYFESIGVTFAVHAAPIMRWFADTLRDNIEHTGGLIRAVGTAFVAVGAAAASFFVVPLLAGVALVAKLRPILSAVGNLFDRTADGLYRVAVAFKPLLEAVGKLLPSFDGEIKGVAGFIEAIAQSATTAVLDLGKAIAEMIRDTAIMARQLIRTYLQLSLALSQASGGMVGGLPAENRIAGFQDALLRIEASADATLQNLRDASAEVNILNSTAVAGGLGGMISAARKTAFEASPTWSSMAASIERANREIGRTREEVELMKAAEQGLSKAQIERIQLLQRQRTILEEMAREQDRVNQRRQQLAEQGRTPFQRFFDEMADLGTLGLAEGSQAWANAAAGVFSQLENATPKIEQRNPAATLATAVDAQRLLAEQQAASARENRDPQERVRRVLEQANRLHEQQRELNRRIAEAVERNQVVQMGN